MKTVRIPFLALVFTFLQFFCFAADQPGANVNIQYERLQAALNKFYEIEKAGGWSTIKMGKKTYQKGESATAVKEIKVRLKASGEYSSDDLSLLFTEELTAAVKRVQRQFGYKENGVVDVSLAKDLNVSVNKRIEQLKVNLARLAAQPASSSGVRLIANIPEFKLHVYEGDKLAFDMNIVVGTLSNKTVIFNDEMKQIVFSPYWNVPPSIVKSEILPKMRGNKDYLWRNGYIQSGMEGGLPVIRQMPGPKNALGQVKFVFPNDHNIYFHDTPAKSLFELRKRAFSHGCIRLAEPAKLAQYLLRNHPDWTPEKIARAMNAGKEKTVQLSAPVAVAITYFTAWVDDAGMVHFREDIYGHDAADAKKLAKL